MTRNKFLAAIAALLVFCGNKLMATAVSLTGQARVNPPASGPALMYTDATGGLNTALIGANLNTSGSGASLTLNAVVPAGTAINFASGEIPGGVIDGNNLTFTLAHPPVSGSLHLFRNGLRQQVTTDYTLNLSTIAFVAGSKPLTGDSLLADYRF